MNCLSGPSVIKLRMNIFQVKKLLNNVFLNCLNLVLKY